MVGLDAARYGLCLPGAEVKALCALMPPKYQAFERGNGMEMVWGQYLYFKSSRKWYGMDQFNLIRL